MFQWLKGSAFWVAESASGSFGCGAHGEAVSAFAQDDDFGVGMEQNRQRQGPIRRF